MTGRQAPAVRENRKLEILLRSGLALLSYCQGTWSGLREEVAVLLHELADYPRDRLDVEVVAGCLALAAGDLDDATHQLQGVVELAQRIAAHQVLPLAVGSMARAALARGDVGTALTCVQALVETLATKGVWAPVGWALPAAVEALTADGQLAEARALATWCAEELRERDVPLGPAALRHAQGILDAAEQRWEEAVRDRDRAVPVAEHGGQTHAGGDAQAWRTVPLRPRSSPAGHRHALMPGR